MQNYRCHEAAPIARQELDPSLNDQFEQYLVSRMPFGIVASCCLLASRMFDPTPASRINEPIWPHFSCRPLALSDTAGSHGGVVRRACEDLESQVQPDRDGCRVPSCCSFPGLVLSTCSIPPALQRLKPRLCVAGRGWSRILALLAGPGTPPQSAAPRHLQNGTPGILVVPYVRARHYPPDGI